MLQFVSKDSRDRTGAPKAGYRYQPPVVKDSLWTVKYEPQSSSELCVHGSKVDTLSSVRSVNVVPISILIGIFRSISSEIG